MRKGLKDLEGVKNVEVSLEKGLAKIECNADNRITLSQILSIVKKNGFSPKSADVQLKGLIGEKQVQVSDSNESIAATIKDESKPDTNKEYLIQGKLEISEDDEETQTLTVLEVASDQ